MISSEEDEAFPGSDSDEYIPDKNGSSSDSELESMKSVKCKMNQENKKNFCNKVIIGNVSIEPEIEKEENREDEEENAQNNNNREDTVEDVETQKRMKNDKEETRKDKKKTKKRHSDTGEWKRKKAARARQEGLRYVNQKGIEIPEKKVNLDCLCNEKCKRKCSEIINIEMRKKLFSMFCKLDINSKNMFLFKSMTTKAPARPQKNATKHKSVTFNYFVNIDQKNICVCKKAFCSIFQVGKKKVEYIQQHNKKGLPAPPQDKRGQHNNRPHKLSPEVLKYITDHISSFPSELSHYSRNNNPFKRYLSPQLNISEMFRLYQEKCRQNNMSETFVVKYSTYAKIFATKFNLSFRQPRSDTCSTCDSGEGNEEHRDSYESAFALQREDRALGKSSDEVFYLTIDLQQTLPLPRLTTSKAFYLRQMWMYNLGIHLVSKSKESANFFTWTEDVANRGSNEICSALLTFIEYNRNIQNEAITHLIIWTDSCAGQNKNFLIVCLYQYLILKGVVKTIDHKFPEVGHSFLDSDRDFGRIEKNLRKHENVYIPDEYRDIISKSSKINHVTDMTSHFRKFDELATKLNLINRKKNTLNETVHFRDGIKWIRVNEFGCYYYKESYDPYTPFKKVNLIKNARLGPPDITDINIPRIQQKYGHLSDEKIGNLKTQLQFVKPPYQWYYQQIM